MGPRLARSSVAIGKPQNAKKKSQKRSLEAFSIASHQVPNKLRIPQHRLGESESAEPRQKRRRLEDDDEDEDDEDHASNARRKRTGREDEEIDEGSDSEGNEWTMGGPIGSDSDSDLDSDEAFGESDEERFEGFTFRGSSTNKGPKKKKQRAAKEMDLDEEDDEDVDEDDEDDLGEDAVDLATMLDNYESSDEEDADRKSKKTRSTASDESEEDEDSDDEDEDEESETSVSDDEGDGADPTKLSKLQDLIASLADDPPEKRAGRNGNVDVHEAQQPSDYGLTSQQKLKISDLLPTVTDPALRKSLKLLSSDKPSKRTGIPGKLDAPLPKRQQDKLDRAAASQKAKETLDRWRDTVIHNRRADFLQFPLKDPNATEAIGTNKMVPAQQTKPANELESAIQNILEESGLATAPDQKGGQDEDMIMQGEELQLNKIPIEEMMARRAELRKARELLFREEVKAKRIKKIKSKSYRRVHRREREREAAKFGDIDGEMDEDDKEKQDRRRAEERMGAKHRESKWAKQAKKAGKTVWDEGAREGVIEMARRNEELRRRIEGKEIRPEDESEGSDLSDDEFEDDDESDEEGAGKFELRKQLDKLDADEGGKSKLGSMAFMQRAEAARKAQNNEDIERMRRDLAGEDSPSEDEDETVGRKIFGPKPKTGQQPKPKPVRGELEEHPASDEEDEAGQEDAEIIVDKPTETAPKQRKQRALLQQSNIPKEDKLTRVQEPADVPDWLPTPAAKKAVEKRKSVKGASNGVITAGTSSGLADVALETSAKKDDKKKTPAREAAATNTDGWITVPYTNGQAKTASEPDSEAEAENPILTEKEKQAMYHARGFAGDDVQVDFEAEKADQEREEDDQIVSNHLPGWGSWAGDGLSKAVRKQNKRAAHNPLHKTVIAGTKAANRKDAKLTNVIISEAQQRKGKKYLASQLPHQFEKKDQYERSLRIPIGPEWTTKETFQKNTRPRVVVKQGIVAPMEKPLL